MDGEKTAKYAMLDALTNAKDNLDAAMQLHDELIEKLQETEAKKDYWHDVAKDHSGLIEGLRKQIRLADQRSEGYAKDLEDLRQRHVLKEGLRHEISALKNTIQDERLKEKKYLEKIAYLEKQIMSFHDTATEKMAPGLYYIEAVEGEYVRVNDRWWKVVPQ